MWGRRVGCGRLAQTVLPSGCEVQPGRQRVDQAEPPASRRVRRGRVQHRLAGATNIAAATRRHARDARRPLRLLDIT